MTYIVIGGSRGIGRDITERLAAKGREVIVMSRSSNDVDSLENVSYHEFDVLDRNRTYPGVQKIEGMVYAPGSITLKPVRTLDLEQIDEDIRIYNN